MTWQAWATLGAALAVCGLILLARRWKDGRF